MLSIHFNMYIQINYLHYLKRLYLQSSTVSSRHKQTRLFAKAMKPFVNQLLLRWHAPVQDVGDPDFSCCQTAVYPSLRGGHYVRQFYNKTLSKAYFTSCLHLFILAYSCYIKVHWIKFEWSFNQQRTLSVTENTNGRNTKMSSTDCLLRHVPNMLSRMFL